MPLIVQAPRSHAAVSQETAEHCRYPCRNIVSTRGKPAAKAHKTPGEVEVCGRVSKKYDLAAGASTLYRLARGEGGLPCGRFRFLVSVSLLFSLLLDVGANRWG